MCRSENHAYNFFKMRSFNFIRLKLALLTSSARRANSDSEERTVVMFSKEAGGGLPEIGLLPFAGVACDAATAILPSYHSRFSKYQFTPPQLVAILCLMRYQDWTFREAEIRLRENSDLRAVSRLSRVPMWKPCFR
jgi:hypothetical protein